ncbi:hypothetical protein [Spirulina sp. 06S082]|uniref:hypothetical protein n=1 Tax=Spirulina sp. 06S082 TaxID=3110248 RepID=UPI002B1FC12D|nr:hypothetical protein [Spirulina sp. 06S082]MEA5467417.1 hypothetical protein [Spirulina sp. 06S082]
MECPVCKTTYVKGKVQRCHVCGWELSSSCLSIVGPLRVEHQISVSSLEKIQAWAHYMWSTQQAQKEQVAKLQRQLNNAQQEGERNRIQLEQVRSQQFAANIPSPSYSSPAPNPSSISSVNSSSIPSLERIPPEGREVLEWILQRFTRAEEERSQLQLQFAQLQNTNPATIAEEVEKTSTETSNRSSQMLLPEQMRDIELLRVELQSRTSLQLSQFQAVERLKEQFQQQIETVTTQIQQISQERDRLHSQLTAQQEHLDRKQEEGKTLQATLTAKCDRLESQLARQQTQIQQLREDNIKLEGAIAERDRVSSEKEQKQEELIGNRIQEFSREQKELIGNHIQEFNREQKELKFQQSHLSEQLQQIRKRWQSHLTQQQMTLQQGSKEDKERQSALETQQMQLYDQMTKILARCDTLESGLENLQLSLRNIPRIISSPGKRANPPVYTKY